jgi:hypothetical protein
MQPNREPPVIAVFPDRAHAEGAIDDLWHRGFRHDEIGILIPGKGEQEAQTRTGPLEEDAARGTTTGAVAGGALGAIIGAIVVGAIPGIGPVLAGGILTGVITGAAAGAAVGVYLGPFVAMGLSESEAHYYAGQLKSGRTLVVVHADGRADEARMVLHKHSGAETAAV